MPIPSIEKLDPREELEKLQKFFDESKAPLIEAVREQERLGAEAKLRDEEKRLDALAEDVKPLAIYCVDLADRADKAVEEARLALAEWRSVAGDLSAKTKPFPDRRVDERHFHYTTGYECGLNANGLLKFCRMSSHLSGQSFVSQTVRSLNRWLDADQIKRASA